MSGARDAGLALIICGLSIGVIALVVLHVLPTGLSPVRNPVSQYGISDHRGGYRVQTLAYGVAGVGAAVGVSGLPGPTGVVVGLCALFAVARMAISWFPMDVPGTQRTETGRRHGLLAICAFGAVAVAAEQLAKLLTRDHLHPHLASASTVLAILMLVTFVGMGVIRRAGGEYFGLVERCFYGCMTGWLVLVAILLSRPA